MRAATGSSTAAAPSADAASSGARSMRTLVVRAMGRPVPISVSGRSADRVAAFAASLEAAWSWCDPTPAEQTGVDPSDPTSLPITVDLDGCDDAAALARVSTVVTTRAIDEMAGEHLLVHAASCADEASGLAAAFVGPSGRGKTTASIELGREFGYLTDEATAVDAYGRVVPYPKPLSVRVPGAPVKEQLPPASAGVRRATAHDWPLGAVFLLDRRPDHGPATPTTDGGSVTAVTVALPDAILALAPELSSLHRLERPLQRLATLIERTGPVLRLGYAEASSLSPVVGRILADRAESRPDRPSPGGDWVPAAIEPPLGDVAGPPRAHRRVAAIDAVVAATTLLVLRDGSVIAAGGLAPMIWERTREWTSTEALREALEADLGRPSDADALLAAALDAMCAAGLLERAEP